MKMEDFIFINNMLKFCQEYKYILLIFSLAILALFIVIKNKKRKKTIQNQELSFDDEIKSRDLLYETFDCIWETDKFMNLKYISPSIYQKLGLSKSNFKITKLDDIFARGTPEELKIQLRAMMSRQKSFKNLEIVSQTSNGEYKWFKANAIAKYNENEIFEGFVGALLDETNVKRKQNEEYISNNLKSLSRISGSIAHEINNPLAYILLSIDSLTSHAEKMDDRNRSIIIEHLTEMKKKSLKISKIVTKLQGVSLHGSEAKRVKCKLSEIIDMAIRYCEYELSTLKIKYNVEIENSEKYVLVKKEEIYKALVNLIHNSIEATEKIDAPWIHIDLKNDIDGNVILSIMDNGEGIPFEKRASIFEPFYTSHDFKNIGLGLTQSFHFVERSGGALSLDLNAKHTKFSMSFKALEN
ncbi:PAS domain-containing sensor histidine kinase [Silvanigrella aquatica]|uniref:histidine kinase n=1 Tax=Silvanigrella aquatica TaxID=1915309 RepID=A0A1L4CY55_9BACT|nr:PAS domain-containing sensor histidine kinase [Silvanigrella aquatica]APJ02879.1 hypothetical protein AXG55_02660 [Silvanigrella aquatica]